MKSNKIVILTSEFPPQPGGIGNHAYNLAKGLCNRGFPVTVICDVRSSQGVEEKEFDGTLDFEVKRILRKKLIYLSYLNRIIVAVPEFKRADVVICTGKFPIWMGGLLSKTFNGKFVAVIHGSELRLPNSFLRKLINKSLPQFHLVIAVSKFTQSLVRDLKIERSVVINNGIHLPEKYTLREKSSYKPILLTVGNVTRRKGQHNVINALPVLLNNYPELQYNIVGIPTEKEKLQNLAEQLKVQKAVKFFGSVGESEKIEITERADIFIMLSEATGDGDVEGFGIAILEANARGIPAIGARGCGIEDAVKEKYSGVLVNAKNEDQILKGVNEILGDYTTYSDNAKLWATGFSWDLVISRYIKEIFER